MAVGTTDRATATTDDAVLDSALSEMQSEGFDASAPIGAAPQDGSDGETGANPEAATETATPGDGGDPGSQTPAPGEATAPATTSATDPAAVAPPTDEPDPLAGAEPFTYTVDGQARTMDGVMRIPGEGLIVPEAQVPRLQLMASRSESLERTNRDLYQKSQELERLSSWKVQGSDGTEQTLTGRDALEAQRVTLGRTLAALDTLTSVFSDPALFASLVGVNEHGQIVPDSAALRHLITRSELAEVNAERAIRTHMQGLATDAAKPPVPPTQDLATVAPVLVQNFATQVGANTLTPEDKTFLAGMLERFIRPATAADVQANPALTLGEQVVDPSFGALVTRQAALRSETATVAKATEKAAAFNANQQRGRQGAGKPAAPAAKAPAPSAAPTAKAGKQAQWDTVFSDAMQEMSG